MAIEKVEGAELLPLLSLDINEKTLTQSSYLRYQKP